MWTVNTVPADMPELALVDAQTSLAMQAQ